LNKLIPLLAFSILLLVPVSQNAFANHPDELTCPESGFGPGQLITDQTLFFQPQVPFCLGVIGNTPTQCLPPYSLVIVSTSATIENLPGCVADPIPTPHITLAAQCEGASFLVNNHCFAQALSSMIGGLLLDIDTVPLLVGAIGVNPIITGLVAITMGGVAAQAAWFVHRRRKSKNS